MLRPEQNLEWSDDGVEGAYRFIKKLYTYCQTHQAHIIAAPDKPHNDFTVQINKIVQQACDDYARQQFNTVVAAGMKILNALQKYTGDDASSISYALRTLLLILAPITPHICHQLWQQLGFGENILDAAWPQLSEQDTQSNNCTIVVQLNGKKVAQITLPHNADNTVVEQAAKAVDKVQYALQDKDIIKSIVVPNRLINLVVR